MLRTFLLLIAAFFATTLATIAVILAVLSYRLHRRNRVAPDVETAAPLHWLSSPAPAARLHRRLRAAVAPVLVPVSGGALDADRRTELCRKLIAEAVELDHQIVLAARLPAKRRKVAVAALEVQVVDVERLALRLGRLRRTHTPLGGSEQGSADVLASLGQELDLLDEAHAELVDIERASGLLDPTALLRDAGPPPPATASVTPAAPALGTLSGVPAAHVGSPAAPATARPTSPPPSSMPPHSRPGS